MGIKGLNKFIHKRCLLKDISVSQTSIVIDGSELLYYLYYDTENLDHRCGGEYMELRSITKEFFAVFEQCRIKAYVVFDRFKCESNLERYIKNQEIKVTAVRQLAESGETEKRTKPLLGKIVLRQTLAEIGVPFVFVPGDGDAELASIANGLEAMVLASDTDFCIFPLSHGFLPFSDFQWKEVLGTKKTSCRGKLFHKEFLSKICRNSVPSLDFLEPLLSSKDGFKGVDFTAFLSNIKRNVRIPNHLKRGYPGDILFLLLWLARHYRSDDQILDCIKEIQDFPRKNFRECLQIYRELPCVEKYIGILHHADPDLATRYVRSYFEEPDELDVPLSILPIVIDDQSQESSYNAARGIKKAGYVLGMFKKNLTAGVDLEATHHILEMDRLGYKYGTRDVSFTVDEKRMKSIFADLEGNDVTESQKRDEIMQAREEFLLTEILQNDDYDSLGSMGKEHLILESTVKYWGDTQDNKPPDEVKKALAFTLASCYYAINPEAYSARFRQIGGNFCIKALHHSSRWQSLIVEAIRLNKFLDGPLKEPVIGALFSGKLFQRAHAFFEQYGNLRHKDAAAELFGDREEAKKFFVSIMRLFKI